MNESEFSEKNDIQPYSQPYAQQGPTCWAKEDQIFSSTISIFIKKVRFLSNTDISYCAHDIN